MFSRKIFPVVLTHITVFREVNSSALNPSNLEQRNGPRVTMRPNQAQLSSWKHLAKITHVWEAARRAHDTSPPSCFSWDTHPWQTWSSKQSPWQMVDVNWTSLWKKPPVNKTLPSRRCLKPSHEREASPGMRAFTLAYIQIRENLMFLKATWFSPGAHWWHNPCILLIPTDSVCRTSSFS